MSLQYTAEHCTIPSIQNLDPDNFTETENMYRNNNSSLVGGFRTELIP